MSEQYDRNMKDIFSLQDEITMKVLTAMRVTLTEGETARVMAKGTNNLEAYLKVMQANQLRQARQNLTTSKRLAEEAIALDPKYALAYAVLSLALANEVGLGQYKEPREVLEKARKLAQKAVTLDDSLAYAHIALSSALGGSRDYDRAASEAQRAIDLEPGLAQGYYQLGKCLYDSGQYEQSVPLLKQALRLSPVPYPPHLIQLASSYRMLGRYEEAIAVLKDPTQREPDMLPGHLQLAAAYMLAGREPEARAEAAEVLRISPNFSLERYANSNPLKNRTDLMQLVIEPLRKAGLK
jgi:adenylate cyclase